MRESDMYGPIWKGAKAAGWSLFRIADGSVGKKPADIAGVAPNGVGVLLEAKCGAGIGTTPLPTWPLYETHQVAWLNKYAEASAIALAVEHDTSRRVTTAYVLTDAESFTTIYNPALRMPVAVEMPLVAGAYRGWGEILQAWANSAAGKGRGGNSPS